jgi:hypothetical protein
MAIITGAIMGEFGPAGRVHKAVQREIRGYAPRVSDQDYAVDVAFVTGRDVGPEPPPVGVSAGMVGRTQRRFIVWHRLPEGLNEVSDVRRWIIDALPQTEALVREYLPRKSKAYPAERLAAEVAGLRTHLEKLDN